MKNYFIALAGNIGAGKTSLAEVLARRLGWEAVMEPVQDNPYLHDFYQDMKTWAFHSQIFYLARTVKAHFSLIQRKFSVVQDRSFYENAEIFTKNLYQQGIINQRDWTTYQELYTSSLQISSPPDLIIYLKARTHTLAERILQRGRAAEKPLTLDYLEQLNRLYDEWIDNFDLCPRLTIPIDNTDLLGREQEQDQIIEKIWEILSGTGPINANHFLQPDNSRQKCLDLLK